MDSKKHWETVYRTKTAQQLSWTQRVPQTSLDLIGALHLSADARILDIGGGDSRLVDFLLDEGYRDITVLDISEEALHRARLRLGERAALVKWVVADVNDFQPDGDYELWHDRATFHFLTDAPDVDRYLATASRSVISGGYAVIGTFSDKGPTRCSGLPVRRYSERELSVELSRGFEKIRCVGEDHHTPFHTVQHFLFCSFKRL